MKKVIKFISSLFVGMMIGVGIVFVVTVLITGKSPDVIFGVLAKADVVDIIKSCAISMAAFVIVMMIQVLVHEGGHLVFGLLSGYRFVSFRVFNIALIRRDGRFILRRYSVAGTGGQCLLLPPDRPADEIPYVLYNTGGVIANLITAVSATAVLMLCVDISLFVFHLLVFTVIMGLLFTLLNGIPMKIGGITNDGYNILLFRRNKLSHRLFINQLRINAMIQNGQRPKDIPEELFDISGVTDPTDAIQGSAIIFCATRLLDVGDTNAAHVMLGGMLANKEKMLGLIVNEARCELLFTSLVLGHIEDARRLYTKELKKYITVYSKTMSSKQRILYAVALLMDNNPVSARRIYDTLKSNRAGYMMQGEVAMDIALMEKVEKQANKKETEKEITT